MNQTVKPELKSPEMKARFFAQYWGQRIISSSNEVSLIVVNDVFIGKMAEWDKYDKSQLLLTPLDHITDEDALAVAMILRPHSFAMHPRGWHIERTEREIEISHSQSIYEFDIDFMGAIGVDNGQSWEYMGNTEYLNAYDYLRSKGYALPYMGHSVQQLIEAGYMKLREGGEKDGK